MMTRIEFKPEATVSARQRKALTLVFDAILSAVHETGAAGAPGGVLYAAMSQEGCTLSVFEQIMEVLVSTGALRRDSELYFLGERRVQS